MTSTTTAHFGFNFDFLTNHIRRLWAEHSFGKTFDLLESCGIPDDYYNDVIIGKLRLSQAPDGIKGVECELVDDTWTPDLNQCQFGKYPHPDKLNDFNEWLFEKQKVEFDESVEDLRRCINAWNKSVATWDSENLESLNFVFKQFDDEVFESLGVVKADIVDSNYFQIILPDYPDQPYLTADTTKVDSMEAKLKGIVEKNLARRGSMLDDVVENMLETVVAETTTDLSSKHGLISPKGEFYPCKYMQHDDLIYELDPNTTQDTLQRQGWVVISSLKFSGKGEPVFKHDSRATFTQATLDALFDWSVKHDAFDHYQGFLFEIDNR